MDILVGKAASESINGADSLSKPSPLKPPWAAFDF
jgi:hypothetical protein